MLEDYKNGCSSPLTLEVYNKLTMVPHIFSWAMYVDDAEDGEMVDFSFSHYGDIFHGQVVTSGDNQSTVVALIMEYDMMMEGGEKERVSDFYGYVELDKLIELLNKIPHINSVMIDMGVKEKLH